MKTESSSSSTMLPDVSEWLVMEWPFIDPNEARGLWFCDCAETVHEIKINAVCLATGARWSDLDKCQKFFRAFPYIVIVCPDPKLRETMTNELRQRIMDTVFYVATDQAFHGYRTVAELAEAQGPKAIDRIFLDTIEYPVYGLLDLADIHPPDMAETAVIRSGISVLDRRIGGFAMGELSVWTGRRGEGKSTLLGELLLEAIDQDFKVCAYSGELQAWKFKCWTSLQAAGPDHITQQKDKRTGKTIPSVTPAIQKQIDEWWRRRFFLYDIGNSATHDAEHILRIFNYAHNFYGCKVFLVDNIMTARFKTGRDADYYRAQSNFVSALTSFARRAGVHVHLIAHPRKAQGKGKHLENDDVGGIADITNLADNVFSLERTIRKGEKEEGAVEQVTALAILKNRMWGETTGSGEAIRLEFDKQTKRFYRSESDRTKAYGWEYAQQMELHPVDADDRDPFNAPQEVTS